MNNIEYIRQLEINGFFTFRRDSMSRSMLFREAVFYLSGYDIKTFIPLSVGLIKKGCRLLLTKGHPKRAEKQLKDAPLDLANLHKTA